MTTKSFLSRPTSLIAIAALLGGSVSTLSAGDEPPVLGPTLAPLASGIEAEFHVGYSSDYIFRGANQGGDLYEFGLDFAGSGDLVGLGAVDLSAGVWYGSAGAADELDVYAEVSKSLNEMLAVAVGITNYSYFGDGDNDIEPYISIGTTVGEISSERPLTTTNRTAKTTNSTTSSLPATSGILVRISVARSNSSSGGSTTRLLMMPMMTFSTEARFP